MLYRRVRGAGGGAAAGALAMPLHEAWQVLLEGYVSHLLAVSMRGGGGAACIASHAGACLPCMHCTTLRST